MLTNGRREPIGGWPRSRTVAAPRNLARWYKPVAVGLTVALLGWALIIGWVVGQGTAQRGELGYDARLFVSFGQRFLDTGQWYFPAQFEGRYLAEGIVNLYPPLAVYLFVPFTVLPLVLWWAIPLGILAWHIWTCRPAPWTWPILALIAGLIPTLGALFYGGSSLWSVAFLTIGLRHPWAAALVGFKPTDAVMWVFYVRRKAFWIGLGVLILAALPFGSLWAEWWTAIGNIEGGSPLRNVYGLPLLSVPLIVWLGARPKGRGVPVNVAGVGAVHPKHLEARSVVPDGNGSDAL